MKKHYWLKEMARDIIALGGLPFFILVLIRVRILDRPEYFLQFIVAGFVFGLFFLIVRQNFYAGLGLIIFIFTSLYYDDFLFSVFGGIVYGLLLMSLFYLEKDWKKILLGILFGMIGVGASFIYPNL